MWQQKSIQKKIENEMEMQGSFTNDTSTISLKLMNKKHVIEYGAKVV